MGRQAPYHALGSRHRRDSGDKEASATPTPGMPNHPLINLSPHRASVSPYAGRGRQGTPFPFAHLTLRTPDAETCNTVIEIVVCSASEWVGPALGVFYCFSPPPNPRPLLPCPKQPLPCVRRGASATPTERHPVCSVLAPRGHLEASEPETRCPPSPEALQPRALMVMAMAPQGPSTLGPKLRALFASPPKIFRPPF